MNIKKEADVVKDRSEIFCSKPYLNNDSQAAIFK